MQKPILHPRDECEWSVAPENCVSGQLQQLSQRRLFRYLMCQPASIIRQSIMTHADCKSKELMENNRTEWNTYKRFLRLLNAVSFTHASMHVRDVDRQHLQMHLNKMSHSDLAMFVVENHIPMGTQLLREAFSPLNLVFRKHGKNALRAPGGPLESICAKPLVSGTAVCPPTTHADKMCNVPSAWLNQKSKNNNNSTPCTLRDALKRANTLGALFMQSTIDPQTSELADQVSNFSLTNDPHHKMEKKTETSGPLETGASMHEVDTKSLPADTEAVSVLASPSHDLPTLLTAPTLPTLPTLTPVVCIDPPTFDSFTPSTTILPEGLGFMPQNESVATNETNPREIKQVVAESNNPDNNNGNDINEPTDVIFIEKSDIASFDYTLPVLPRTPISTSSSSSCIVM